jgi:sarcosine oxidase subunit gamma
MIRMENGCMADAAHPEALDILGPSPCDVAVLRLRAPTAAHLAALGAAFGLAWPMAPNTSAHGSASVLWLAPGEWAIIGIDPAVAARHAAATLDGALYHLADVSDGTVQFQIGGARSRDLLAKGCSLDLHARVFRPGACARTRFAQLHALLHLPAAGDRFDLFVDASVSAYLSAWLHDATIEFATSEDQ